MINKISIFRISTCLDYATLEDENRNETEYRNKTLDIMLARCAATLQLFVCVCPYVVQSVSVVQDVAHSSVFWRALEKHVSDA